MQGPWKLIHYYEYDRSELFNLDDDPGEQTDLSRKDKATAERLESEIDNWVAQADAPIPTVLNDQTK